MPLIHHPGLQRQQWPSQRMQALTPILGSGIRNRTATPALHAALHSRCVQSRRKHVVRSQAVEVLPQPVHKLADIDLQPILNDSGIIRHKSADGTAAAVFGLFDEQKKLLYIGFSKDLETSLKTVFSRRPDKAWYYKSVELQEVDQKQMMAVRDAWIEEVGGIPPGNKLALERNKWQLPAEGDGIDAKGGPRAAQDKADELLQIMKKRGCTERFTPKPDLMLEGKVDFIPEGAAEDRDDAASASSDVYRATTTIDGKPQDFRVIFEMVFPTNGGAMCDVVVSHDGLDTSHRVIVAKQFYEPNGQRPQDAVANAFAFLLQRKVPRRTEGTLLSNQFPINYFSVSELRQWFDDFDDVFQGAAALPPETWGFRRVFDYGGKLESNIDAVAPLNSWV